MNEWMNESDWELQELPIWGRSRDADPVNNRLFLICTTAQAPRQGGDPTRHLFRTKHLVHISTPYDLHKAHTSPLPGSLILYIYIQMSELYFEEEKDPSRNLDLK